MKAILKWDEKALKKIKLESFCCSVLLSLKKLSKWEKNGTKMRETFKSSCNFELLEKAFLKAFVAQFYFLSKIEQMREIWDKNETNY